VQLASGLIYAGCRRCDDLFAWTGSDQAGISRRFASARSRCRGASSDIRARQLQQGLASGNLVALTNKDANDNGVAFRRKETGFARSV
jgi:hypothetical protein